MHDALLSSKKMDWCTPQDFFDKLDAEFHFTLDAASSDKNAKCKKHFTILDDGLSQDWGGNVVFCNPPYGKHIQHWVQKAYYESLKPNTTVVMLIPVRTDTLYWHNYIFGYAEIRFVCGRLKFIDDNGFQLNTAPFPSAVVIWRCNNA